MKVDVVSPYVPGLVQTRVADYLQLVRPRFSAPGTHHRGHGLASGGGGENRTGSPLALALIGTALLFAGASSLNQLLERHSDALMPRNREPTAARRASAARGGAGPREHPQCLRSGLSAGTAPASGGGTGRLCPLQLRARVHAAERANPAQHPDRRGAWCRAAADWLGRGRAAAWTVGRWALFLIVFLWQIPHSLAIAWIYRDQYAGAGIRVLPVLDPQGRQTGRQMIHYTLVLILASLMPCALGIGGWFVRDRSPDPRCGLPLQGSRFRPHSHCP